MRPQAHTQTMMTTVYKIEANENLAIDSLNIIDTPGFGDSRGISADEEIKNQLSQLFLTPLTQCA
jgi:septin family protein